jgi:hypothetical protein
MIEWFGYDYDSYIGDGNGSYSIPGWSGLVDVDSAQTGSTAPLQRFIMPGSKLSYARNVIISLSDNRVNNNNTNRLPILYTKCHHDSNLSKLGYDIGSGLPVTTFDNNTTIKVSFGLLDNTTLSLRDDKGKRDICEQYYLAWSAYAIVPEGNNSNDFNLTLRYNYQPWNGEDYNSTTTSKQLLAEHVSTFRAMQVGDSIRVKVCINDGNITGIPYGFCKEKAIY